MSTEQPIHPVLARVLEANRDGFNQDFLREWRLHPGLEAAAIHRFCRTLLSPLLAKAKGEPDDRLAALARAAFPAAVTLEAKGASALGEDGPLGLSVWGSLFPSILPHLTRDPDVVLPSILNAVWSMNHPAKNPGGWIASLAELGPLCPDSDSLLKLGQVLAWTHGQAQFRHGAMALLPNLPSKIRERLFPGTESEKGLATCLDRMGKDPWFVPGRKESGLRGTVSVGAFRGLGGAFKLPPEVKIRDGQCYAVSAGEVFQIHVDGYGQALNRVAAIPDGEAVPPIPPPSLVNHLLMVQGKSLEGDYPGRLTSWAWGPNTLAFTTTHSHRVFFVALT